MAKAGPEPARRCLGLVSWSCFLSVPLRQAMLTSVPLNHRPPCQDLPADESCPFPVTPGPSHLLGFWSLLQPQLKVIQETPHSPESWHLQDVNFLNPNSRIYGGNIYFENGPV